MKLTKMMSNKLTELGAGSRFAAVNWKLRFLTMTAKMNSELSVCCVPDTFMLSLEFVPKIEMYSIYNEACQLN